MAVFFSKDKYLNIATKNYFFGLIKKFKFFELYCFFICILLFLINFFYVIYFLGENNFLKIFAIFFPSQNNIFFQTFNWCAIAILTASFLLRMIFACLLNKKFKTLSIDNPNFYNEFKPLIKSTIFLPFCSFALTQKYFQKTDFRIHHSYYL